MLPITYLFVPGDRPERFDKACASAADATIIDLEDAVGPDRKSAAREAIARWPGLPAHRARLLLRVNDAQSAWFADDLALARHIGIECVMLPKTESAAHVAAVRDPLPTVNVIGLIETARGARDVDAIAAAPGVQRLAFGTIDFALDLDLSGDERGLWYTASRIASASRAAGIGAPVAGVTTALEDGPQMQADLAFARATGCGAKLCIHPRQLDAVRRAFTPGAEQVEWARRVLAASAASGGAAVQVDGKMVDRPVILRAEAILARAGS